MDRRPSMRAALALALALFAVERAWAQPAPAPPQAARPPAPSAKAPARSPTNAAAAAGKPAPVGPQQTADLMAVVNGEAITREQLGAECVKRFGKEVLEMLVNRQLIQQECQRRKIQVTKEEIDEEIKLTSGRLGIPSDQFLGMLERERGVKPQQYTNDILWPQIALRKLARDRLQVTDAEIQECFESEYGPSVKVRLILCNDEEKARRVHALALQNPENFPSLARNESDDPASRSMNGLVQPIRKHVGDKGLEQAAFALKEGEISPIMKLGPQWAFLKCEQHFPPRQVEFEAVRPILADAIRDTKLRGVASDLFRDLQAKAKVDIVLDDPKKVAAQPQVAAIVDGQAISVRSLAEACLDRHGAEALDGEIDHRLLRQACKKANVEVTQPEIDQEISRAAKAMGFVDKQGQPDVARWMEELQKQPGFDLKLYVHDTVWPTVALKKLVGNAVQVTPEDLNRAFEANYGPRVQCRAIVLNSHRRAQEVWEMAKENPTPEHFGDLAEQYSVEPQSRALRGEVPDIQRWGGQPELEKEAFALKPGEISGVIQVADSFLILRCENFTEAQKIDFNEVKPMLQEDMFEKKLRLEMARRFEQLKASAQVDNYLAGTSQDPAQQARAGSVPKTGAPRAGSATRPETPVTGAVPASGVRKE